MTEAEFLDRMRLVREGFGVVCKKMTGAATVEVLREALAARGLRVSRRDVFVRGVPIEVDLLLLRDGARGEMELIYRPEDVLVAVEVKNSGVFDEGAAGGIRRCFETIGRAGSGIRCVYVTLAEQKGYKNRITSERIGFPAYTLFDKVTRKGQAVYTATGEWDRLLADLCALAGAN